MSWGKDLHCEIFPLWLLYKCLRDNFFFFLVLCLYIYVELCEMPPLDKAIPKACSTFFFFSSLFRYGRKRESGKIYTKYNISNWKRGWWRLHAVWQGKRRNSSIFRVKTGLRNVFSLIYKRGAVCRRKTFVWRIMDRIFFTRAKAAFLQGNWRKSAAGRKD